MSANHRGKKRSVNNRLGQALEQTVFRGPSGPQVGWPGPAAARVAKRTPGRVQRSGVLAPGVLKNCFYLDAQNIIIFPFPVFFFGGLPEVKNIQLQILDEVHRKPAIKTVAVYSEAYADSLHVRFADEVVCIGPPQVNLSYLNIPMIIATAQGAGVDAIHPGYGFSQLCHGHAGVAAREDRSGPCHSQGAGHALLPPEPAGADLRPVRLDPG